MIYANSSGPNGLAHPAKPIHWQEGLFLQPQHFQWQDLYFQSLIDPLNRFLHPCLWGIGRMSVHEEALSNGIFSVLNGEFRFRDMTHAVFPGNAVLESRNFEHDWKNKGKPFTVYLGVRKLSRTDKNVSDPGGYDAYSMMPTRYAAETDIETLADLYQGGEALPIERMRYVLKLLWEEEKGRIGDYEIIPIARLESRKGEVFLVPDYIPPVLSIASNKALQQNIRSIHELVTATIHRLEAYKKDRGVHNAEFGSKDMVFLFTLRTLNRFAPMLRHMDGKAGAVHPWAVYGLLCQLAGELSTFSAKINLINIGKESPFYLLDYAHEDLTQCFKRCRYILGRLMADITSEPEYVVPLNYDGQYFAAYLPVKLIQGRKRFYLSVETEANREHVIDEIENLAKMSSPDQLAMLILQSLRGIELTHIAHPPPELPRRAMGIYFEINREHRLWTKVLQARKLVLSWDSRPKDARIELMVAGGEQ